jgi:hypothetical protein
MPNVETPKGLKGDATPFGVFFPKDYVLAVFRDPAAAERAAAALEVAGFAPSDVLVLGSDEVLGWHGRFAADAGLVGRFKEFVATHFPGAGAKLHDVVDHARVGHAFVLVHAPDGARTDRATTALRPVHPAVLQKYNALTVAELK